MTRIVAVTQCTAQTLAWSSCARDGYPHTKPGPSHLPKKSVVPSAMVPATNTPRAIRVGLLAALLLAGAVSPSIGMGWDGLVLEEVWFCSAAVVSGAQLLASHIPQLSSFSLLFTTSGFCREPFPRHFLLSPPQSKIMHS